MKKIVKPKKIKTKKIPKVTPKYLPLTKSKSEVCIDNIFIYASVAVITVALTLLFISLFDL